MADLTVLSPQPLIILHTTDVSGRFSAGASLQHYPSQNVPASGPSRHEDQPADPTLLSPPRKSFRARNRPRQQPPPTIIEERVDSSGEVLDEPSDTEIDEQTSYTHSFRPFTYPSSPNLALLTPRHQDNLRRPPPPLCVRLS